MISSEEHTFSSEDELLSGTFVNAGGEYVVLLCHGYMSNQNSCRFAEIADALGKAGISSFRFDHPCSMNGKTMRKGPFKMGNFHDEVNDIANAVNYIESELNKKVQIVLGHSKGGTNVVIYAAMYSNVPNIINLSGRFIPTNGIDARFGKGIIQKLKEHPEGLKRKEANGFEWTMTYEDFMGRCALDMVAYANKIKEKSGSKDNVNLLCLHGRQDSTISYKESIQCADEADAFVTIIPGDHNFTRTEDGARMIAEVVKFCSACCSSQ